MELQEEVPVAIQESSEPFIGRWQGLVSTTNWEKGKIIWDWRKSLQEDESDSSAYSDETWSQMVGDVTAQHVGRLRRVHEKFGDVQDQYEGLYWSHFHAAIDWEDAELWLEGALQKKWSISEMRRERAETLGDAAEQTAEVRVIEGTIEDVAALAAMPSTIDTEPLSESVEMVKDSTSKESPGPADDSDDAVDKLDSSEDNDADEDSDDTSSDDTPAVKAFEDMPELPSDLSDSFEELKVAILRHKTDGWRDVTADDVVACLDAMKAFVSQ